jgi:two-component system, OmpR family, KDP operon response regulator KdpE
MQSDWSGVSSGMHLLAVIIEDDASIRRVERNALTADFPRVTETSTGSAGIDAVASLQPDVVLLDLGLPDMEGLEVCREIRKWSRVPILVLSARHRDDEKVELLDAGADDYMTKPFSTAELRARVRALLRRSAAGAEESQLIEFGPFAMDLVGRALLRNGAHVHLTRIEWSLLRTLAMNAGKTLTHQQLFAAVWAGRRYGDAQQHLRVHVANLRRKIEDDALDPRFIVTEPGVGYRFSGVK